MLSDKVVSAVQNALVEAGFLAADSFTPGAWDRNTGSAYDYFIFNKLPPVPVELRGFAPLSPTGLHESVVELLGGWDELLALDTQEEDEASDEDGDDQDGNEGEGFTAAQAADATVTDADATNPPLGDGPVQLDVPNDIGTSEPAADAPTDATAADEEAKEEDKSDAPADEEAKDEVADADTDAAAADAPASDKEVTEDKADDKTAVASSGSKKKNKK